MSVVEVQNWAKYFRDNPAEKYLTRNLETTVASFAGYFGGKKENHLIMSQEERERIAYEEFTNSMPT